VTRHQSTARGSRAEPGNRKSEIGNRKLAKIANANLRFRASQNILEWATGFHMNGVRQRGRGATQSPCGSLEATEIVALDLFRRCDGHPIDMAMVRWITELSSYRPTCSCGLCSVAARVKAAAREVAEAARVGNRGLSAAEQDQIDAALPKSRTSTRNSTRTRTRRR